MYINLRTRKGCDYASFNNCCVCRISIHAPVKGATIFYKLDIDFDIISIHAPVKGATEANLGRGLVKFISIHAPVKGATGIACEDIDLVDISIHAPVKGATKQALINLGWTIDISIHAPVKGATVNPSLFSGLGNGFQSTPP